VLAGDALHALAFEWLVRNADIPACPPARVVRAIGELTRGIGTAGMVGGQVLDLLAVGGPLSEEMVRQIHRLKTGSLIRACLRIGATLGGAPPEDMGILDRYGEHVGLAFQIVDDILDVEESSEALGKTAGKDAQQRKITFPAVYGLERSRAMANVECERAHGTLAQFGDRARRLHEIADMIVARKS